MNNTSNKKKKGIIRTGLLSLIFILVLFLALYFKFFFDSHLKWVAKKSLTSANCAQVDIGNIRTTFKTLEVQVSDLEFSNYSQPDSNLFEIGTLRFNLNWQALLRLKGLVENAALLDLNFNSLRESVATVYPKCKEENKGELEVKDKIDEAKNKILKENALAQIIKLLKSDGSLVNKLDEMKSELKTHQKINEISTTLKLKKAEWEKEINLLKDFSRLKLLTSKAKAIKISKEPLILAKQFQEFQGLKKEADLEVGRYKSSISKLKEDVASFKNISKDLEISIQEDKASLQKYLKIPNMNVSEISQDVFSNYIKALVAPYMGYWQKIQEKIPQKNADSTSDDLTPTQRAKGVSVHFPIKKGYPKFWLKHLDISLQAALKESSDKTFGIKGFVKDFSSDESIVGKPMSFELDGDLPKEKLEGIQVSGVVRKDNETKAYSADVKGSVKAFPIKDLNLSRSQKFKLVLKKAHATTHFSGTLGKEDGSVKLKTIFDKADWFIETDKAQVSKILSGILGDIPKLSLNSLFSGNYFLPKIKISSDFDRKFKRGISKFVDKKIQEAQGKIKSFLDKEINERKATLINSLGSQEKEVLGSIFDSDVKVDNFQSFFKSVKKDFEEKQKEKIQGKVKKELNKSLNNGLDNLKKKLKLPF